MNFVMADTTLLPKETFGGLAYFRLNCSRRSTRKSLYGKQQQTFLDS